MKLSIFQALLRNGTARRSLRLRLQLRRAFSVRLIKRCRVWVIETVSETPTSPSHCLPAMASARGAAVPPAKASPSVPGHDRLRATLPQSPVNGANAGRTCACCVQGLFQEETPSAGFTNPDEEKMGSVFLVQTVEHTCNPSDESKQRRPP